MTMVEMFTKKALKAYATVYELYVNIQSQTRPSRSRSSLHEQWRVGDSTKEILNFSFGPESRAKTNGCAQSLYVFDATVLSNWKYFDLHDIPFAYANDVCFAHGWPLVLS